MVLLSKLPFVKLFSKIVDIIAPEFFDNGEPGLESGKIVIQPIQIYLQSCVALEGCDYILYHRNVYDMICTLEGDNVGFVDLNFASYIPSHKVYSTARLSYRQPK